MYKTFEEAEAAYYGYWYSDQPEPEKAIEIAEYCYSAYKEHENQIIMDLIVFYGGVGRVEDARKMLQKGFDKGNWYPKEYFSAFWDQDAYAEEREIWEDMRIESEMEAGVIYKVKEPRGFDINKSYPVFISLHGWGEDLPLFEQFWDSEKLREAYLHVLIQSSQMVGYSQFVWNDRELAMDEITCVLNAVRSRYKVADDILIGGFSQGATLAMDMAFSRNAFKVNGFIALNPSKLETLDEKNVQELRGQLKGCLLTGDQDKSLSDQQMMAELFEKCGLEHLFLIKENFGHWFPDDLSERIDRCIEYMTEE